MVCPECKGEVIIEGKIYNQVDYINPPVYFRPTNSPFYAILNSNVKFKNSFFVCSSCGFLWTKIYDKVLTRS